MNRLQCVMLDLDGTIYLGNRLFPYTADFLARLTRLGIGCLFLTNNSSRSTDAYLEKLARMGIQSDASHILISSHAAANYLNAHFPEKRVFLLGTDSMRREMESRGIRLCEDDPEVLLAGFDTDLNYDRLTKFANFVADGLPYIATHPDRVCPAEHGFLPDLGSIMELIFACCGRRPDVVCGKPEEQILIAAEQRTGFSREHLLMVGDRLTTDIAIGQWGVKTCLVLSGEARKEDIPGAPIAPTYVFPTLYELGLAIEKARKNE